MSNRPRHRSQKFPIVAILPLGRQASERPRPQSTANDAGVNHAAEDKQFIGKDIRIVHSTNYDTLKLLRSFFSVTKKNIKSINSHAKNMKTDVLCTRIPDSVPLCQRYSKMLYTGWPKKSKPPPIFQKIALKIANEIRFLRKVKV